MMNKLYHLFNVFSYKGGELNSNVNLSFEELVNSVDIDIDDLREAFGADEASQNISDEEFEKLSDLELLNLIPDSLLNWAIENYFYPGNEYAFDSYSDYEVYESTESGELKEINPCYIPGFTKAVKEHLIENIKKYG